MIKKIIITYSNDDILEVIVEMIIKIREELVKSRQLHVISVIDTIYSNMFVKIKSEDEKELSTTGKSNLLNIIGRYVYKSGIVHNTIRRYAEKIANPGSNLYSDILQNILQILDNNESKFFDDSIITYRIECIKKMVQGEKDKQEVQVTIECTIITEKAKNDIELENLLQLSSDRMDEWMYFHEFTEFLRETYRIIMPNHLFGSDLFTLNEVVPIRFRDTSMYSIKELCTKKSSTDGELIIDSGIRLLYTKKEMIEKLIIDADEGKQTTVSLLQEDPAKYEFTEEEVKVLLSIITYRKELMTVYYGEQLFSDIILRITNEISKLGVKERSFLQDFMRNYPKLPNIFKSRVTRLQNESAIEQKKYDDLVKEEKKNKDNKEEYHILSQQIDRANSIYNISYLRMYREIGLVQSLNDDKDIIQRLSTLAPELKAYLEKRLVDVYTFSPSEKSIKKQHRNNTLLVAGTCIVVAVVIGGYLLHKLGVIG